MCIGGYSCLLTALIFIKPVCASYNVIAVKDKTLITLIGAAATSSLISSFLVDNIQKGTGETLTIIFCCLFAVIVKKISSKIKSSMVNDLILPITILFGLLISVLFPELMI